MLDIHWLLRTFFATAGDAAASHWAQKRVPRIDFEFKKIRHGPHFNFALWLPIFCSSRTRTIPSRRTQLCILIDLSRRLS